MLQDTDFIEQLLNYEAFIRYAADKQDHTVSDACDYSTDGPVGGSKAYRFGLNLLQRKILPHCPAMPIGLFGLLKRPELDCSDLGFAFFP